MSRSPLADRSGGDDRRFLVVVAIWAEPYGASACSASSIHGAMPGRRLQDRQAMIAPARWIFGVGWAKRGQGTTPERQPKDLRDHRRRLGSRRRRGRGAFVFGFAASRGACRAPFGRLLRWVPRSSAAGRVNLSAVMARPLIWARFRPKLRSPARVSYGGFGATPGDTGCERQPGGCFKMTGRTGALSSPRSNHDVQPRAGYPAAGTGGHVSVAAIAKALRAGGVAVTFGLT